MSDSHSHPAPQIVQLSGRKFLIGCIALSLVILILGRGMGVAISPWVMACEVFATIIGLFVFGSMKYQLHKNPLTYGAGLVVLATFFAREGWQGGWDSLLHGIREEGVFAWLDGLIHLDTMLFILGLTFFVCVIAQTRLLEAVTFFLLRANKGKVLPTVLAVLAVVSFSSGILDGVSMIGLTIRTLVIILVLAAAPTESIRYAVTVCTVVTTVCGMWLAYGEPPNLIMKANLLDEVTGRPLLTDGFFLRYCLPAAVVSFACVAISLRNKLKGLRVDLAGLDVLDSNVATLRFLQVSRHGETLTPVEFAEAHHSELGNAHAGVMARLHHGEPLGLALVHEKVPVETRCSLMGKFVDESLADPLDRHYQLEAAGDHAGALAAEADVGRVIKETQQRRLWSQRIGAAALIPFIALLIAHALHHHTVPLFLASLAGFVVAIIGIWSLPRMRGLALREAWHEYAEYYFLFPLFLSITLLTKVGFFDQLQVAIQAGVKAGLIAPLALAQFGGATFLSALLDNNVVADFASRGLHGLDLTVLHLFAMSQIAGYALGGCWTHIGSAQSVVAYSFIQRDVDERFTPFMWIRQMTPLLTGMLIALGVLIVIESFLLSWLH